MQDRRAQQLVDILTNLITERRRQRIDTVLDWRTRYVTVVLEDIYSSQNASAVLRSCECFGLQDVHAIENHNAFVPHTDIARGAEKWLDIYHYREADGCNTTRCLSNLKDMGYSLVATGFRNGAVSLEQVPLDRPVAICFGTEEVGLSDPVFEMADTVVQIPMFGFTRSFNLSVSAALCLQTLCTRLRSERGDWRLTRATRQKILLKWLLRSVRKPATVLRELGFEDMVKDESASEMHEKNDSAAPYEFSKEWSGKT